MTSPLSPLSQDSEPDPGRVDIHWGWKLSALAAALFFIGLGALAVITKQHVGSARYSATPVVLSGDAAVAAGWILMTIGLLPLIVFARSRRWGARLAIGWAVAVTAAILLVPMAVLR